MSWGFFSLWLAAWLAYALIFWGFVRLIDARVDWLMRPRKKAKPAPPGPHVVYQGRMIDGLGEAVRLDEKVKQRLYPETGEVHRSERPPHTGGKN